VDDFERAAQHEEEERRIALQQHASRAHREPRADCEDCGVDLEQHRHQYGTCIDCQTSREARAKHYRQG